MQVEEPSRRKMNSFNFRVLATLNKQQEVGNLEEDSFPKGWKQKIHVVPDQSSEPSPKRIGKNQNCRFL